MNLEALTLLETPTVRQLVATWPRIGDYSGEPVVICRRWQVVSGVAYRLAWKWYNPLLLNEVIRLDGAIDAAAADYIAQCALSRAKFTAPERAPKRRGEMQ